MLEGFVIFVIGCKCFFFFEFNEYEEFIIVEEILVVYFGLIEVLNLIGLFVKCCNVVLIVGLVVLGVVLGSIGIIVGFM